MNKMRKIAIFADCHGMLEPLEATLADIKSQGIDKIYSLGDNIGNGPNPKEVMDLLIANEVKSVAGNAEYYISLGMAPFFSYFDMEKINNELWTIDHLDKSHIELIENLPPSICLTLGGKKIALCHFAGDVRTDWLDHGQSKFQILIKNGKPAYDLFDFTNSPAQIEYLNKVIELYGRSPYANAITSQLDNPLFGGKSPLEFDYIIQGHVHFEIKEGTRGKTKYYTIRANGMGYGEDPKDTASYIILTEKEDGFDITRRLVKYDREKMIRSIEECDIPSKVIIKKYADY